MQPVGIGRCRAEFGLSDTNRTQAEIPVVIEAQLTKSSNSIIEGTRKENVSARDRHVLGEKGKTGRFSLACHQAGETCKPPRPLVARHVDRLPFLVNAFDARKSPLSITCDDVAHHRREPFFAKPVVRVQDVDVG